MKTYLAILKTAIAFIIFMILFLAAALFAFVPKHLDLENYASFVNKNSAALSKIAESALEDDTSFSVIEKFLLERGKIDHVWAQENRVIFSIDQAYAPVEGSIQLIYQPDGEYVFPFDDPEWYEVDTANKNTFRWEGGYAGGNGTVDVIRMNDHFFLEDAYLPT